MNTSRSGKHICKCIQIGIGMDPIGSARIGWDQMTLGEKGGSESLCNKLWNCEQYI